MIIKTKMLFILIGNDRTGKTTIQKNLIEKLCGIKYKSLPTNVGLEITHPEIKRKYYKASFGNRSYQEKIGTYGTVDEYFENHFNEQKIAFISSHLNKSDIDNMIRNGKARYYNVYGVFFTNISENEIKTHSEISELNWDERFVIENPIVDHSKIDSQLEKISDNFVHLLINRTKIG